MGVRSILRKDRLERRRIEAVAFRSQADLDRSHSQAKKTRAFFEISVGKLCKVIDEI